jgi:hypothetical protein
MKVKDNVVKVDPRNLIFFFFFLNGNLKCIQVWCNDSLNLDITVQMDGY